MSGMAAEDMRRPPLLVGLKDISKALGLGLYETRTLIRSDTLPTFRIGRSYAVPADWLADWLASRRPAPVRREAR